MRVDTTPWRASPHRVLSPGHGGNGGVAQTDPADSHSRRLWVRYPPMDTCPFGRVVEGKVWCGGEWEYRESASAEAGVELSTAGVPRPRPRRRGRGAFYQRQIPKNTKAC